MITPENMTLTTAREELQSIATSIEAGLPNEAKRLRVVAEFLRLFGNELTEGMQGLTDFLKRTES